MDPKNKNLTFENCIQIIDEEVRKRKHKWKLSFLTHMDYDDVSQIVKLHIYHKWNKYDQKKPLIPWLNRVITNQIKNISRNNFINFAKPCLQCPHAMKNDGCKIYGEQGMDCSLFKRWAKNKKHGHNLCVASPLDDKDFEIQDNQANGFTLQNNIEKVHKKLKEHLKPNEWKIYELLYIQGKSKIEIAKLMNYKTSEINRCPGYKNIKKIEKNIIKKIKNLLKNDQIDVY